MSETYLPQGLAKPGPMPNGLDVAYWEGTRAHELRVQRCNACGAFQWGPEFICHKCHADDFTFERVEPTGVIYSWERVWHPVHPALKDAVPYLVVLVELPQADGVRMVGNLLGDAEQTIEIGARVEAVFEDHDDENEPFTLVQWQQLP